MLSSRVGIRVRWRDAAIYIVTIVTIALFAVLMPGFLSAANLRAVLISMVLVCTLGLGATFVITAGEIDISMGALLAVPSSIIAALLRADWPLWTAFTIALASTLFVGLLNGLLTTKLRIPSFVTTLGTMGIAMGLSRIITNNTPIPIQNKIILDIFGKEFFGIPKMVMWMFLLILVSYVVLHKLSLGRNIHCVGDNREAARLYGISTTRTVVYSFLFCAGFSFFAGILEVARSTFASAGIGEPLTLSAIVAAVIGGTSLQGGKGSIAGTFIGALFLTIISNGLFSEGLPPWISNIIIGGVIIITLTGSGLLEKRERVLVRE